jgi:Tfp pilus assembly protein PilF
MELDLNRRIDRFANRELHPAAARALAHEALNDTDLFDELTAVALAQTALASPAATDRKLAQAALDDQDLFDTLVARGALEAALRAPGAIKYRRPRSWLLIAAVAAIAAVLVIFFLLRPPTPAAPRAVQQARMTRSQRAATPTILLTDALQPARPRGISLFRGAPAPSRPPKSDGSVLSIQDGIVTVNLGSLDGLAKGTELSVVRSQQIGRIAITTVFRERARGTIVEGFAQTDDQVRVPNAEHLAAILQQVDALAANGDLKTALESARDAIATGSSGETRPLLERLAALDYQAGAPDAAREHYEVAVNNFDQPPAASPSEEAINFASYGALLLLNDDPQRAGEILQKALAKAEDPALRAQILNNLGAATELAGDRAKAAGYYQQALTLKTSKSTRNVTKANLARLNSTTLNNTTPNNTRQP